MSRLKKSGNGKLLLCIIISFFLVMIPLFFTPISSDDFIYVARSSDWSNIFWRYMNWSGRLVADTGSLILLQLPPIIYKILKGIIWVSLITLISYLPTIYNKKYTWKATNFIIVFLLYWIANPNLGQTSFWTVGFSNYLLTNFFIVAYISLLFYLKDKTLKFWHYLAIIILGLFAGNSNENTAIVIILLTIVFVLIEERKKVFLIGLPFTIIGTLTLLLSPGQYERMQHPAFQTVREQNLFQRLWNYFSSALFIDTFKSFSWIFVMFILIGFIYFFKKQIPDHKNLLYSLIFFFSAVIANAAFGGSYVFPVALRSLNGALILFLISITFFMASLSFKKNPFFKNPIFYLVILLCYPFILGYYFATKSVISLNAQFKIREQVILKGKENDQKNIYIPNFYVGKLYNSSDSIDLYLGDIASYYNVPESTTIQTFSKDFSFDYGNKKIVKTKQTILNRSFGENIYLKGLNIFRDARSANNYSVNLTFDSSLLDQYSSDNTKLFIHVNWNRSGTEETSMFNADTSLNNQLLVDGQYIFSSPIGDIRPQDIKSVYIGIYDTTIKSNIVETNIEIGN